MIGVPRPGRAARAVAIGLLIGLGFGLRSADPAHADPPLHSARDRALMTAAVVADEALAGLGSVLTSAIDHARSGSASTVAGDRPPAPELLAAADLLVRGSASADAARRTVAALAGIASAIAPDQAVVELAYGAPDLLALAASLRSSAVAAALFVERRRATTTIVNALAEAVSALDRGLPQIAIISLDATTDQFTVLDAWIERPSLLRYWERVIAELIDAARGIATATIQGDELAQKVAGQRYAKAAEAARGADNALAVSLAEEGGAVTVISLQRLAAIASAIADARATVRELGGNEVVTGA